MFQPNQFHVHKPWRRPFETHTVISEGARPGSPLGLLQHSRRVHFLFLPSCFTPRTLSHTRSPSCLGEPSHSLLLQLAAEIGSGWVWDPRYSKQSQWWAAPRLAGHHGTEHVLPEETKPAGWMLGAADGQLATRRESVLEMIATQRKDRRQVVRDTASRHSWFRSLPWTFPGVPRSPFCLDFIRAVAKGISQSPLDKHLKNKQEAIQWSQSRTQTTILDRSHF